MNSLLTMFYIKNEKFAIFMTEICSNMRMLSSNDEIGRF